MSTEEPFTQILRPYQKLIEEKLLESISRLGPKNHVRDACEYALLNGGKRFRPALVLMVAADIGYDVDVIPAALGIEYFHTASLIADDLPCMDNDDERRNKPTTHRVYGESTALLATYALIAAGYACVAENAHVVKQSQHPFASQSDRISVLALENATLNTGLKGTTGGQLLDLSPPNLSLELLREVIHKKTVTLFEISFVWGWLFGGGDVAKLSLVKSCASHFGMAFQIADDIDDREQDIINQRTINLANVFGLQFAKQMFHEEMKRFHAALNDLNLSCGDLQRLGALLGSFVPQ